MRERVCGKPRGDAHAGARTQSYAGRLLLSSGNDQKGARMWQKYTRLVKLLIVSEGTAF